MIHVRRTRRPPFFADRAFLALKQRFEDHWLGGGAREKQVRTPTEAVFRELEDMAIGPLRSVFGGKCAYTEEGGGELTLMLHRPPSDALDIDGTISAPHYWWLAMRWENWYMASPFVVSVKRNQFPVFGPRLVVPESADVPFARDAGLLLDPCVDRPEWYLEFSRDGSVRSRIHPSARERNRYGGLDRGGLTIEILDLDHTSLGASRRAAIEWFLKELTREPAARGEATVEGGVFDPALGHLGCRRQVAAAITIESVASDGKLPAMPPVEADPQRWIQDLLPELAPRLMAQLDLLRTPALKPWAGPLREYVEHLFPDLADAIGAAPRVRARIVSELPVPERKRTVVTRSAVITEVHVKNFKIIEDARFTIPPLEVDIPSDDDPSQPVLKGRHWKALLGENGAGKSSLLQAIGLALAGETLDDLTHAVGLEWGRVLRRGARQGRVLLRMTGGSSVDLRFNDHTHWYVGGVPDMQGFVRAFGATRLLGEDPTSSEANVRIANLYDPRQPLVDANQWLLDLREEGDFNVAAVTIARLLDREQDVTEGTGGPSAGRLIRRDREQREIFIGDDRLSDLSDGYRSIIALVCDLMAGAGAGLSDMQYATGIVLIDEIGAHLHPRWQMSVTRKLRRALPSMQFIVSTHDPLCLLGLVGDEVVRVEAREVDAGDVEARKKVFTLQEIDVSPTDYRVDRLLTSEFFGLHSTVDPRIERLFQEYYRLQAVPDPTVDQKRQIDELRRLVNRHGVLGYTRRDQLVYEAIDEFLRDEQDPKARANRVARRKEMFEKVRDIWQAVDDRRRPTETI